MMLRFIFLLLIQPFLLIHALAQETRHDQKYYDNQSIYIAAENEMFKEKFEEAIKLFDQIKENPQARAATQYQLSKAYYHIEEPDKAIKAAKIAIESEPENVWYYYNLAELYSKYNNDADAAKTYQALLEKFPDNDYYSYKYAYYLARANQPNDALKVYDKLEKKRGLNEELARRRHTLFRALGKEDMAEEELINLSQKFPNNIDYLYLLASYYEENKYQQKALQTYQKILTVNPKNERARVAIEQSRNQYSSLDQLAKNLRPQFEDPTLSLDAKIALILPAIQKVADTGNQELANQLLLLSSSLEKLYPSEAKPCAISGDLYYYSNKPQEAAEKYKTTLNKNPSIFLVWKQYLSSLFATNQAQTLIDESENALDVFPNQAEIYIHRAKAFFDLQQIPKAKLELSRAKIIGGKLQHISQDIRIVEASILNLSGDYEASDKLYQEAIDNEPNFVPALLAYANSLASRSQNLALADKMIHKVKKIDPNNIYLPAITARFHFAKKDYQKAIELYAEATQVNPYLKPSYLENYGDAYFEIDQIEKAKKWWNIALNRGGNTQRIKKKLTSI